MDNLKTAAVLLCFNLPVLNYLHLGLAPPKWRFVYLQAQGAKMGEIFNMHATLPCLENRNTGLCMLCFLSKPFICIVLSAVCGKMKILYTKELLKMSGLESFKF